MTADEHHEDPVLERYLRQADESLARAEQTLPVAVREEYLRMASQWLLLAEEYLNKSS